MSLLVETRQDGTGGATLSPCGRYRYHLWRQWDRKLKSVLFIMLNPSTADALQDDPTVRRCIGFAQRWGYGGVELMNLFAHRATNPVAILSNIDREALQGPQWLHVMLLHMANPELDRRVVCAWGAHGSHLGAAGRMADLLDLSGFQRTALARNRDGSPGHPLYLPASSERLPWKPQ